MAASFDSIITDLDRAGMPFLAEQVRAIKEEFLTAPQALPNNDGLGVSADPLPSRPHREILDKMLDDYLKEAGYADYNFQMEHRAKTRAAIQQYADTQVREALERLKEEIAYAEDPDYIWSQINHHLAELEAKDE